MLMCDAHHRLIDSFAPDVYDEPTLVAMRQTHRDMVRYDHGWMLVPGGMKKIDLPASLVGSKWARAAMVKGQTAPNVPVFPWFWNPQVLVASPPGAGSFIAGVEYAHGGVSLQECVIPEIIAERGVDTSRASIGEIKWVRLIRRISVNGKCRGGSSGFTAQLDAVEFKCRRSERVHQQ